MRQSIALACIWYQAFQPSTPACTASTDADGEQELGGGEVTALEVQEECDMASLC